MTDSSISLITDEARGVFGAMLVENVPMGRYSTSRVGGPADGMITVSSITELIHTAQSCWRLNVPFHILGGGSNILVADSGYRGIMVLNKAQAIETISACETVIVRAESGANMGLLARKVADQGWGGLEWAAGIPGTVGGAIYGNAGAHGGEICSNLVLADILHRETGRTDWTCAELDYRYRSSILKRDHLPVVILAASFKLQQADRDVILARMDELTEKRRSTQPTGASMGSVFKNPPGDHAGRLVEAAGLKGARIGGALISSVHANFIINDEKATARDIWELIQVTRREVSSKFGVELETEIEFIGNFMDGVTHG
jgi:UDP-N-acetylmuramate dehydrogenase